MRKICRPVGEPAMKTVPDRLCVHPETGAVIGWSENGVDYFPEEWIATEDLWPKDGRPSLRYRYVEVMKTGDP